MITGLLFHSSSATELLRRFKESRLLEVVEFRGSEA
jgi:hypothetical protein